MWNKKDTGFADKDSEGGNYDNMSKGSADVDDKFEKV